MTTPPKYEELVLKVAELERREDALREELSKFKACCVDLSSQVRELEHKMDYYKGEGMRADSLQQRLTVAEQKLGDAYEWGYGDGQQSPNGYSDKEDRDKCVAELLKQAADCEHGYSNQTGCPVCQGIKP